MFLPASRFPAMLLFLRLSHDMAIRLGRQLVAPRGLTYAIRMLPVKNRPRRVRPALVVLDFPGQRDREVCHDSSHPVYRCRFVGNRVVQRRGSGAAREANSARPAASADDDGSAIVPAGKQPNPAAAQSVCVLAGHLSAVLWRVPLPANLRIRPSRRFRLSRIAVVKRLRKPASMAFRLGSGKTLAPNGKRASGGGVYVVTLLREPGSDVQNSKLAGEGP